MTPHAEERAVSGEALDALTESARALASAETLQDATRAIASGAGRAAGAEVVVARVVDARGEHLAASAVYAVSPAVAAELEGSRAPASDLPEAEVDDPELLPQGLRRAMRLAGLEAALLVPLRLEGRPLASLELLRARGPFGEEERRMARLAGHQLASAARVFGDGRRGVDPESRLVLAGEALAAGSDSVRTPEQVTRLAVEASGATAALLWRVADGEPELAGTHGAEEGLEELGPAAEAAARALLGRSPLSVEEGAFHGGGVASVTLQLGQPVVGALQLLFPRHALPTEAELSRLATFGIRAAHALRASSHSRDQALELERTRALLSVAGEATAQLSLGHTLRTAVDQTAALLGSDRLAVYLRADGRLLAAAGHGLSGPHLAVAERLLELLLGPYRARTVLVVDDVRGDPSLAHVAGPAAEAGIGAAIAAPLLVHEEDVGLVPIGLLAVYPPSGRTVTENESALLTALARQLAVAVQNAQLHEQTKRQEEELKTVLDSERRAATQLRALYEISQSFTVEDLSLDGTLQTVAKTVVDVLGVDAAVVRMPDERRELLMPRALHVAETRLAEAVETILFRPQALRGRRIQRLLADRKAFLLDPVSARELGDLGLLAPFLQKGWTGAVVPMHTPAEMLAVLSIFSLHPERPVDAATLESARQLATQAALAIDRARLYEQRKEFADTMQRSLMPRASPHVPGLEVAATYAASSKVDVGGDVYDFLALADGRLAVVLGDVTGHGIDATADMAMAKFVFRSLAREHSEPGDFLSAANEVVVGEIAPGKFITMLYLAVDGRTGAVSCAGAGHPSPRLLSPDGTVEGLDARGLVLGIADDQRYEEVRATLEPGGCVVLYTDGVTESRQEGELFGTERLDAFLTRERGLSPDELAAAVLEECRAFSGGELADDCAIVVVKRT